MGVKDLWSILSPSCEKKSLWELHGLTVAIDLSSWIVDSQNIGDSSHLNMYQRNLFFRTTYLLLLGVKPVFILEGKAPALKHDTMARRQHGQHPPPNKSGNRGRLNCLQKRCEELLMSLGVKCYKSDGEAEALCSRLNALGVVDAVISQDSDCFLYGAKVVLRNFTMGPQYTCDMYTMENIERKLDLGRHKLIALSLLCGCDYEAGVHGVGKQLALRFLATLRDDHVLDRLRNWRNDTFYESQNSSLTQEQKVEMSIRKRAILDSNFPSEDVINEFLSTKNVEIPSFIWLKPSLPKFMVIADRMLAWEDEYASEKFMPLLTRWHLLHDASVSDLRLLVIVKKRTVRGTASYELQWEYDGIGKVTTIEPTHLVQHVYPELHEAFVKSKEKPKRGGKKKPKQECEVDKINSLLENMSIIEPTLKKKKPKQKHDGKLQTLDRFLLKENRLHGRQNESFKLKDSVTSHSTPIKHTKKNQTCHHLSDSELELDSPLRTKSGLNKQTSYSLENIDKDQHSSPTKHSIHFESFLESSMDSDSLNLSEIVNSIVTRKVNNPAVSIWTTNMK